jgi:hypothetical protein
MVLFVFRGMWHLSHGVEACLPVKANFVREWSNAAGFHAEVEWQAPQLCPAIMLLNCPP